jgi:hypothetical protein
MLRFSVRSMVIVAASNSFSKMCALRKSAGHGIGVDVHRRPLSKILVKPPYDLSCLGQVVCVIYRRLFSSSNGSPSRASNLDQFTPDRVDVLGIQIVHIIPQPFGLGGVSLHAIDETFSSSGSPEM